MKLATQSYVPALKLGFRDGMAAIKAAGFDSVDMSLFRMDQDDNIFVSDRWETTAYEERSILDELDLPCSQAHAPHIFDFSDERTFKEIAKPRIIRSMKIAKILGAKCIVIHPLHHLDYRREKDRLRRMNHEYMLSLAEIAAKLDIRIGFENMWQRDAMTGTLVPNVGGLSSDLASDIDSFDSPYVKACLDVGHSALVGENPDEAIRTLGRKRLIALHVHDNNLKEDQHTLPYLGKICWPKVMNALEDIGYEGDFTYEADNFLRGFPSDLIPSALSLMVTVGRFLISQAKTK